MAPRLVYDLIDPQELISYVREFDIEVLRPTSKFTLGRWLPDVLSDDLQYRIRKGALNDVDAAEFRAWDTPAPMTGRPGVTRIEGELGPISRQIPLGEEEYLRQRALLAGTNDPVIDGIYADAERMIRAVQARIELMKGDVIDDGVVTISEGGLVLEADFGRDATMSKLAGTFWTDPTAPMLTDLLGWVEDYTDQNGTDPGTLLMPKARLANFALNDEIREYAAINGSTPSRLNVASINNVLESEGLPPIELYDTTVRIDGVKTRVLPANKVYLMPPADEPFGTTFYGITAEALKLADKGLIEQRQAPGLVAVVTETDHPVQTYTVGAGISFAATPNPDLVLDAQVAA